MNTKIDKYVAASKALAVEYLGAIMTYVEKAAAVMIIVAGSYLTWYQFNAIFV